MRINPDNTLTYNPEGQFDHLPPGETATDVFQYVIDDGHGGRDIETVTVTVHGVDNPQPVADQELLDSFEVPAQGPTGRSRSHRQLRRRRNGGGAGDLRADRRLRPPLADPVGVAPRQDDGPDGCRLVRLPAALDSMSPIEAFLDLPARALPHNADKNANTGAATKVDVALTDGRCG